MWPARNGAVTEEKALVLDALRDLDLDYQLGSLTAEDYRQLQADLRRRALAALKAEDQEMVDIDQTIEQAVAAERARRQALPEQLIRENGCPHCGERITGNERFCPSCGAPLAQGRQAAVITAAPPQRRPESAAVKPRPLGPWFLAAAESLRGQRGLPTDLGAPPDAEAIRGAKEWLSRNMQGDRTYSATVDQSALAQVFDLARARRADSFDKCYREVSRMLNQAANAVRSAAGGRGDS